MPAEAVNFETPDKAFDGRRVAATALRARPLLAAGKKRATSM